MGSTGVFVTIEGIEGAGKTTQARLLAEALRVAGRQVVLTREPGGGDRVGETLRSLLKDPSVWQSLHLAEIYLYAAARAHHLESLILPALASGRDVICDRYLDSTRAYQGFGRGRSRELIEDLHSLPPLDTRPLRTLLLGLPPEEGLLRARQREDTEGAGYDEESLAFFQRVSAGFDELARQEPERIVKIDASADPLAVHRQIVDALAPLFPGVLALRAKP